MKSTVIQILRSTTVIITVNDWHQNCQYLTVKVTVIFKSVLLKYIHYSYRLEYYLNVIDLYFMVILIFPLYVISCNSKVIKQNCEKLKRCKGITKEDARVKENETENR